MLLQEVLVLWVIVRDRESVREGRGRESRWIMWIKVLERADEWMVWVKVRWIDIE